jgi:transcriptional regulator with XRE-family HTH domain
MKVQEKIRFLRNQKGWSQEKMAEKLSMTTQGYAKVERGETDYQSNAENYLAKLAKIANILGVNLEELIMNGDKAIYLVGGNDNNSGNNVVIGSPAELAFENQKQQLIIELKDKELALQQREIAYLKKMLEMSEKLNGENHASDSNH